MSFDDAGTFEITTPGQPVSPHTTISSTNFNSLMQDVAEGISTAICKDGQSTVDANIPMNSKKFTGLAAGSARTDSASLANLQDGTGVYVATVGGTADVITLTASPAITAYAAGQTFRFIASGANTTNVTVNVSSIGAKAITKNGTTALVAGDIPSGAMVTITYDGTRFILGTIGLAYLPITGGTLTGALSLTGGGLFFTDATYDIGATGATRPRDFFLSRNATIGDKLNVAGLLIGRVALGGHIHGLTLSNNGSDATNDIDIAAGTATSGDASPSARYHMALASGITKRLDATWVVGTNQGFLDTGAIANATYHIYVILRSDTGVVDILASTSASAPTMPTNYDFKRRIGSIIRSGATILPFTQTGDEFLLTTPALDIDAATPGTSAVTAALQVPTGINVRAVINVWYQNATDSTWDYLYVSDLAATDAAPNATSSPLAQFTANSNTNAMGQLIVRTNTSRQIRYRTNVSDAQTIVRICTTGWFDRRNQDV